MCFGTGCLLKERCVRFLSESAGENQTYFLDPLFHEGKCKFFWELRERQDQ